MQKTNGVYGAASPPFHLAHYQSDVLRKTCAMLSRKIECPCGFLALSGIPVAPQNLCGVSGRPCTPIYGAFRGMPNAKCPTFNNIISAPELRFILRLEWFANAAPEDVPKPLKDAYERIAPNPQQFPGLVAKVAKLLTEFPGWRDEELRSIGAPVMLIVGDHDFIRPEHAVQMLRLIPNAQLAVLPGAGHDAITERHEDVLAARSYLDKKLRLITNQRANQTRERSTIFRAECR